MKQLQIVHLGLGAIGKEVYRQIAQQKETIEKNFGVSLKYASMFTSKNSTEEIHEAIQQVSLPFVLIDTTASDQTVPYIRAALERGGFAVLANKKPLAGEQVNFDKLHKVGGQRLFYECVVGAGLPVIRTIKDLLATGDEIIEIQGCFSGTLGFLFSQLDQGKSFSKAVLKAKEKGFTEPDPRDDLSGKDVARKTLILARIIGQKKTLEDIQLKGLYPTEMQELSVEEFLRDMHTLDEEYKEKVAHAKSQQKVLQFVAKVNAQECRVDLQEIDASSDIGSLRGPDNVVVIKTKRYFHNPLVIKGPGAGVEVTAAGVFADILSVARIIEGTLL